jgi:hypothetical protein
MYLPGKRAIAIAIGIPSLALAAYWAVAPRDSVAAQSAARPEQIRGLVSRHELAPPLRGPALQVRFSPDGAHILIQDEAGIYILTRQPLGLTLAITAPRALPARFSADSKTLIVGARSLNFARYDLALSWKLNETPPLVSPSCLAVELSADGELVACYDTELRLRILRTTTGEEIFSDQFRPLPPRQLAIPVPRGRETAFAEPFGYFYAAGMKAWIGRREFEFSMAFSPDNRFLLARDTGGMAMAVDVASRQKIETPRFLNKSPEKTWSFVDASRVVVMDSRKGRESEFFVMPDAKSAGRIALAGMAVAALCDPRYLRVVLPDGETPAVFDLQANRFLENLRKGATDILGDTAVTYSNDGEVSVYKLGESSSFERQVLPLEFLPPLRVVSASPDLQNLAISFRGAGAIYRAATGEQFASLPKMNGAWFSSDGLVYLRSLLPDNSPAPVQKLELKSGKIHHPWFEPKAISVDRLREDMHSAGPVLLVDSPAFFSSGSGSDVGLQMKSTQAYALHALEMELGTKLWERRFTLDVPVPFADPQGERVVLGWIATTEAARAEAKHVLHGAHPAKLKDPSEHDTFFEVVDSRTGKIIGALTVRVGAGPEDFESVFSVGDSLILVKDDVRITVFSLSTGLEIGRYFGSVSAASGESNLLAANDHKHLKLYDLKTGAKKDEYVFPDEMAYLHFSADGKRLLALTTRQVAYVLDVTLPSIP